MILRTAARAGPIGKWEIGPPVWRQQAHFIATREEIEMTHLLHARTSLLATFVVAFAMFLSPAFVHAQAAPGGGGDATITEDDVIAGTMNIDFKTRTNSDTRGDLKEGSAALGAQDKYSLNLNVAKTTEFAGDIVRQPKLSSSVLGRTKQNAKLA